MPNYINGSVIRSNQNVTTPANYTDGTSLSSVSVSSTYNSFTVSFSGAVAEGPTASDTVTAWAVWIYRYADNGLPVSSAYVYSTSGSHTFTGLDDGLNYRYIVRILRKLNGSSSYTWGSPADLFNQPVSTPARPTATFYNGDSFTTSASVNSTTETSVDWSYSQSGCRGTLPYNSSNSYQWIVSRGNTDIASYGPYTSGGAYTCSGTSSSSGTDTGLSPGSTYTYRTRMVCYNAAADDYNTFYTSSVNVTIPSNDPPTGNWESTPSCSGSSTSSGITITSSAGTPSGGGGSYDSWSTTSLKVYRSLANANAFSYVGTISGSTYTDTTVADFTDYDYKVLHTFKLVYKGVEYPGYTTYSATVEVSHNFGGRTVSGSAAASFGSSYTTTTLSATISSVSGAYDSVTSKLKWQYNTGGSWLDASSYTSVSSGLPKNYSDTHVASMIDPAETIQYRAVMVVYATYNGETSTEYLYPQTSTITKPVPNPNVTAPELSYSNFEDGEIYDSSYATMNAGYYDLPNDSTGSYDRWAVRFFFYRDNVLQSTSGWTYGDNVSVDYFDDSYEDTSGTVWQTYTYKIIPQWAFESYGTWFYQYKTAATGTAVTKRGASVTFGSQSSNQNEVNYLSLSQYISAISVNTGTITDVKAYWVSDGGINGYSTGDSLTSVSYPSTVSHSFTNTESGHEFALYVVVYHNGTSEAFLSPYTSTFNLNDPGTVTADVSCSISESDIGHSTEDRITATGSASNISVTSGFTVTHTISTYVSTDQSNWSIVDTSGSSGGSINYIGPTEYSTYYDRGDTIYAKAILSYTIWYAGSNQGSYTEESSIVSVVIPAYDGPTGTWASPITIAGLTDSASNNVTFTVPTTASGTGNYDYINTTSVIVQRSPANAGSWTTLYTYSEPTQGTEYTYQDTSAAGYTSYDYRVIHGFGIYYVFTTFPRVTGTNTSNEVELTNTNGLRTASVNGSATLVDNTGTTLDQANLDGNVTGITGEGTLTSVFTRWEAWNSAGTTKYRDVGEKTSSSFTHNHAAVDSNLDPEIDVYYRMYYEVVMNLGGNQTTTGYLNSSILYPNVPDVPNRIFTIGLSSSGSGQTGEDYWVEIDWTLPSGGLDVTYNTFNYEVWYREVGSSTWLTATNGGIAAGPYYFGGVNVQINGLTPYVDYEAYATCSGNLDIYDENQNYTDSTSNVVAFTPSSAMTFDVSTPTASLDALSRATLQATMSNYNTSGTISLLQIVLFVYIEGVYSHQVVASDIANPSLPQLIIVTDDSQIPEGQNRTYEMAVNAYNSTYGEWGASTSAMSGNVTGIAVADRDVDVAFSTIANTSTGIEVSAEVTGVVGPGYDNITLVDSDLKYRVNGSGSAWTVFANFNQSDDTFPMDVGGLITGLVDTTVYDIMVSTRVVGDFLSSPFDYTVDSEIQVITFNATDNSQYNNDLEMTSIGYNTGGIQVKYISNGITFSSDGADYIGWWNNNIELTVQRRLQNSGDTWVDLYTDSSATFDVEYSYTDTTGTTGTAYDYRIQSYTTIVDETGDGKYNTYRFYNTTDHQTIEFIVPIVELIVDDYEATVEGYFTVTHSSTSPTATGAELKRREYASIGTTVWSDLTDANIDTVIRRQILSVREIWGYAGDAVTEQPSNMSNIILAEGPDALTNFTGLGRYAGNRLTWSGADINALVRIKRDGSVLQEGIIATSSEYIDSSATAETSYSYTASQYYSDAGFELHSTSVSTTSTRPTTPALPDLPEIDCAAYFGRDASNSPSMHLAPQGTSLVDLKSSSSLSDSYFHSSADFIVVTDIKTSTGSLDSATKSLLASRAFLCTIIDSSGAARASDMVLRKNSTYNYGTWSSKNLFSSSFSFGSNTAYYDGGSSVTLPSWGNSIKFYFLNVTSDGQYIDPRDSSDDILISRDNLRVNGLGLDNAMLLCGIGSQSDGSIIDALNYHDDIIPFNGGTVDANTYAGSTSAWIQVLGAASSSGWQIIPNKGRIDRTDGAGNIMPWWNAGFGRSRMEYLSTSTTDNSSYYTDVVFDEVTDHGNGFFSSSGSWSSSNIDGGANVLIPLGGTHVPGDMYGIIVTPIGDDELEGTVSESYGSGKGTLVWSDLSSSMTLAEYSKYYIYNYNWKFDEPEPQVTSLSYSLNASRSGNYLSLSISGSGHIEGRVTGVEYRLSVAPLRITIIKMR